ncbi:hypothetical protein C7B62_02955 [Pleurocapsa sp. CCALA 161]|uniref:hypothetical protein n=1 Tax=Pleurocapsa sp. CCALA 161 TaxID=2107688 RepID=UPI000D0511EF|nr:hypothetical protein [Pleurocapsa sp. CCALA 161]PSB12214.1 hypothetical protein C7B62_02955 [Pleurocapsa sp. CCALA 161]
MQNISLIAFYGDKPAPLASLIQKLQTYLANHQLLQDKFIPYQLNQVHGTIIGCEGWKTDLGVVNQWFKEKRQETKYIDFAGLINYLQHQINLSITIRFGGYDRNTNYNFLSRDRHLYHRSVQLQSVDNNTIPVLIGWSWQDHDVTLAIDNLRRELQRFNLLHKYHAIPDDIDNDFYLRLGTINAKLTSAEIEAISTDLCNWLKTQHPLYISITLNDLAFAQYQDLTLTPATTQIFPVAEITANQLKQFG